MSLVKRVLWIVGLGFVLAALRCGDSYSRPQELIDAEWQTQAEEE